MCFWSTPSSIYYSSTEPRGCLVHIHLGYLVGFAQRALFKCSSHSRHGLQHRKFIFLFYLPYLSSIHKKSNCIAMFWTERRHSIGSCHLRCVFAICLLHKSEAVPLNALPNDTTSELAGLFSTTSPKCRAPSRKAVNTIFYSRLV